MIVDYCSDLHINNTNNLEPNWKEIKTRGAQAIIVAGDITNSSFKFSCKVLTNLAEYYDHVLFVDGNHEHYKSGVLPITLEKKITDFASKHDNIHYLAASPIILNGVTFVGCNGWYTWKWRDYDQVANNISWNQYSNDSKLIKTFDPLLQAKRHVNLLHTNISREISNNKDAKFVVVTHTAPSESLIREYTNPVWNELNGSYCNVDMDSIINMTHRIKYWIYGHTHNPVHVGAFRNNCRGYMGEIRNWTMRSIEV